MTTEVSPAQLRVLSFLKGKKDIFIGEITSHLGCTPGNTTGLIARLVDAGMISRSENKSCRRKKTIRLTEAGIMHLGRMKK